jgi:N-acetylglucosamine-6-phosphate deacetylase
MRLELPGLFDLQVNGFGGIDFNGPDLTADRAVEAVEQMRAVGVTRCLPTLVTSSFTEFARSAHVLARITSTAIAGIHMEGPTCLPRTARAPTPRVAPPTSTTSRRRTLPAAGSTGHARA